MITSLQAKMIKSAERVLSVLEYFTVERSEATVTDIVRAYGLPQSSTSELLRCLASLGYLSYDPRKRTFRPTARVALLGAWVLPNLFRHGNLLAMMDELSKETGELIVAGMPVGLSVRYVHALQATNPDRMVIPQGTHRPLMHSAMGRVMLASMPDEQVRRLVHRLNAEGEPKWRVPFNDLQDELRKIRAQGYALTSNHVTPGGGMVAVLLPDCDGQTLSIGIGGTADLINERGLEFAARLRDAVARHLTTEQLARSAA
jgi:DNA-binding IclR family transcriptional regulator